MPGRVGSRSTAESPADIQRRKQRTAARELAQTPVADPYRGQLRDPHAGATPNGQADPQPQSRTDEWTFEPAASGPQVGASDVRVAIPPGLAPGVLAPGYALSPRGNTPRAAVWAGVLGVVLGALTALFGFVLLAGVALVNALGDTDRSFYGGRDASMVVIGLLDLGLAAMGVLGGIALLSGRLAGRLWLTVFGWTMLGLSCYWVQQGRAATVIPLVIAAASAAVLLLAYPRHVTRWLGVQPPPQPE